MKRRIAILTVVLALAAAANAESLTGTVTNGTTGKPAANADVVLISLTQGMSESGRTKTDADGRFTLNVPDPGGPHLVRVPYAGVNYHKMAPPGSTTADVSIYEAAPKVDSVSVSVETAYETEGSNLKGVHFFTVRNVSQPARTQAGERAFEFVLPEGAVIDAAQASGPGGQPIQQSPTPTGQKNHYAFAFPLRPGETVFQIGYHIPYSGSLAVTPKVLYPVDQFAVILPEPMKFEPKNAQAFEGHDHQNGIALQISASPGGKDLSYRISGNGRFPEEAVAAANGAAEQMGGGAQGSRGPGGGLGNPIDAPDPLSNYRWPLVLILSGLMGLGALFLVGRNPTASASARGVAGKAEIVPDSTSTATAPHASQTSFLDHLKNELFQLEVDRRQGKITQAEYEEAKGALDKTLARALDRERNA